MKTITVRSEDDKYKLYDYIMDVNPPMTVTIKEGVCRSSQQNKLQGLWFREVAEQLKEYTPEGYRAYCKLHFGIPIRRANDPVFKEMYDETIRSLTYEQKLSVMQVPIDLPVTRDMTVKEMNQYMNEIYQFFTGLGAELTSPKEIE
jgi:hypothetical protein